MGRQAIERGQGGEGNAPESGRGFRMRYILITGCLALVAMALQWGLHEPISKRAWLFLLNHSNGFEGLYFQRNYEPIEWTRPDTNELSGLSQGRLVLINSPSARLNRRIDSSGRPWEITFHVGNGCDRRPYNNPHYSLATNQTDCPAFSLVFSERGPRRTVFQFSADEFEECGLYQEGPDGVEWLAECRSDRVGATRRTSHTMTLRGEGRRIVIDVNDSECLSATLPNPLEELLFELSTPTLSCAAFDDLAILVKEPDTGWRAQVQERFSVQPLQIHWFLTRFDLDSRPSQITILWAALAFMLLVDLFIVKLSVKRSPVPLILVASIPQTLLLFSFHNIFAFPYTPLLLSIGVIWSSRVALALTGDRTGRGNLLLWVALCCLQTLHWFWFREICHFVAFRCLVLLTLLPAILTAGLYWRAARGSEGRKRCGTVVTIVMTVICVESLVRATPADKFLSPAWRTSNAFWDLRRHTNLVVDHSQEEIFTNEIEISYPTEKAEGVFRIACLGSSSTAGGMPDYWDPRLYSYPMQLQGLLNHCSHGSYEVINAGIGGYGLTQLRIYYEEILSRLDPDLLIIYYGYNRDNGFFTAYYERVGALLEANPDLQDPEALEAALSLRYPHPILVKANRMIGRSRLFMGIKLMIDAGRKSTEEEIAPVERMMVSHELLIEYAVKRGTEVLLIPELTSNGDHRTYAPAFKALGRQYAERPVHVFRTEEFDQSLFIDRMHMNPAGYGKLAGIISDYMIDTGMIDCDPTPGDKR